jgi:hypothetical protein
VADLKKLNWTNNAMSKDNIISLVETGVGDIWKIIEYYADPGRINELLDCVNDPIMGPIFLYIGSELPRNALTSEYVSAVESLLQTGTLSARDAYCAADIVEYARKPPE